MAIAAIIMIFLNQCSYNKSEGIHNPPNKTSSQKIVYAKNGKTMGMDLMVPNRGECVLEPELINALNHPENSNAKFYVYLNPYRLSEVYSEEFNHFTFEGKTINEWKARVGYSFLSYDDYINKRMDNHSNYTHEELLLWKQEWDTIQNCDQQTKLHEALKQRYILLCQLEVDRLDNHGIHVELAEDSNNSIGIYAYLSKEQVLNFPCGEASYYVLLAPEPKN